MQLKLMLLFFLISLAPLSATGLLSVRTAEELILNMASDRIEQVVADKAALLERWISERKADIEVMAGSSILRSMDPERIAPYLELAGSKYRVYSDISAISLDGRLIYGSPDRSVNFESQEWFIVSSGGKPYMSDISLDPERKESFFRISAPLVGASGAVEGVLCATVGTGAILSDILRVSLGVTGECYLVSGEGEFLAHKEPVRILSENIAQSESFRSVFSVRKQRIVYIDYRGIEVIGASRRVGGTDWALVVEQDRDEAFQSADELRRHVVAIIALSALGAFIAAWLLSRYVVSPVRKLARAANCLAQGDFEKVHLETDRNDEIGLLYTAFDDMAGRLRDRQHRLEEKVTLREAELKETDVKLKRTREAAARSQQLASLGQLAAGVAHEIRTPLTSLKMFLESIENEMDISPEYEEDYRVAGNQVRRMENTINRFLDFARPREPTLAEIDVLDLIEDALPVVGMKAKKQETVVRTNVDDGLPTIRGDRKQLGEALLNLMLNALEAMGARGELTVTARMDEPGGGRDRVRIEVADTGPGVPVENIPRLFEPFFTTKATGTGLGLSIVYGAVKRHGGEVIVEDGRRGGAVFSMLIPVGTGRTIQDDGENTDS